MDPSPLPVLTDSSSEGLAPDAPPRLAAEGTEELDRVYSTDSLEQFQQADPKPEPLSASTRLR